ncbi:response regulator transcription factor [Aeromonas jandaei]|uniref:response regulator transcription factor n=1 Tax=Aeromonas jandaei TaxID=650 RepID=UPI002AA0C714|nr:response regulator transcription factor [Aeromonas jandaei]
MSIRVVLADDHPIMLVGLRSILKLSDMDIEIVAEYTCTESLCKGVSDSHCDLLITDLSMPGCKQADGLALIRSIRNKAPNLPIIVLTQVQNPSVLLSLKKLNVSGVLLKGSLTDLLINAIKNVMCRKTYLCPLVESIINSVSSDARSNIALSPRETEVVRLFSMGLTVTEISKHLNRSVKTISTQKNKAMMKLNISCDADLIRFFDEQ